MRARIALLPGDGIGPEVVAEGVRVLAAVAERWGHAFETISALIGGAAIDATGNPLPDETIALCRESDAVLLGAVGGPKWDDPRAAVRPEQGLLAIRAGLGLWANLRPSRSTVAPSDADGNSPIDPANTDASSVRMSPNMFSVTITSNACALRRSCMAHASTST